MYVEKNPVTRYWKEKLSEDVVRLIDDVMEFKLLGLLDEYSETIKIEFINISNFIDIIKDSEFRQ